MRILWLKTELLHPVDKGGRIRTYQMLRALAREHEVTYLTLDDGTAAPDAAALAREYCARLVTVPFKPPRRGSLAYYLAHARLLWGSGEGFHAPPRGSLGFYAALAGNLFSSLPYAVTRYRSRQLQDALVQLLAEGGVDVLVCDFLTPAINVPEKIGVPTVLFQHNVEAEIWRRHAEVGRNPVQRAYFGLQWRRMARFERATCKRFDVVAAVSEQDAAHFRDCYGVREAVAIPTGVDTDYFQPGGYGIREDRHLVFTGSMDWMPNEDGIMFFADRVMPLLRQRLPGVRLSVVGRAPTPRLLALADSHDDITVTGRVPDVRPWLARASAAIVPLRVGGGTRLKIYEAMAMECPVVSTTIGAEGLPLIAGEHLLVADDPEGLAEACSTLLLAPDHAREMAASAARYVRERFGWEGVARAFTAACATARDAEPSL